MNNVEKNLDEFYSSFYYESNVEELLNYISTKFDKITLSGIKDGLVLDNDSERQLIHRLLMEGINFYISEKLKSKLISYEENISEQPMLLAHPSSVTKEDLINFINPERISELIKNDYTFINKKVYPDLNEYSIYKQYRYLYLEGNFEDTSEKNGKIRTDLIFKHSVGYFKKSKHVDLNEFSNLIYYLPFELNKHFSNLQLQINDYVTCSYFNENQSYIDKSIDSSFTQDSGKKLTVIFPLFPDDLEISKREINLKLTHQNDSNEEISLKLKNPLSCVIFKARKFAYSIEQHSFPFILVFYYIHGPVDKSNFSC